MNLFSSKIRCLHRAKILSEHHSRKGLTKVFILKSWIIMTTLSRFKRKDESSNSASVYIYMLIKL